MKYVYLVQKPHGETGPNRLAPRYALTYNRRHAFQAIKHSPNARIYRLSYGYFKDCHFCMDAPTFIAVSERIA